MKIPADMRKQFERQYPQNAKLRLCEWCRIYHRYSLKPSASANLLNPEEVESQVMSLLQGFIFKKASQAFQATKLYLSDDEGLPDFTDGYVSIMAEVYDQESASVR